MDRHNDYIQLYVKKENGEYFLTDGGYIITDLIDSGCPLDTSDKRKGLLETTLAGFGIKNHKNQIFTKTNKENYPVAYNNLIQALISIDDLFYTSSPHVESLFYEDVSNWLTNEKVRFSQNIKLTGKSGFNHEFHFLIPKSENAPERVVQAISNPLRDKIEHIIWMWEDSKGLRKKDTTLYAILNDSEKRIQPSVITALESYGIQPALWSHRNSAAEVLAA